MSDAPVADQPTTWPVSDSRDLHRDTWVVALREDDVHRPGHPDEVLKRLVVEHPGAVIVLAVDDMERVLCLQQYRHPGGHVFVELPAGLLDEEGEEPVETAKRELREEAQLQAHKWRPLLATYPSAGLTAEVHHIFLARGLSFADRGDFELEGEEAEMTTSWVPMADLLEAVLSGRVQQGPLAQAVLVYAVLSQRGELAAE